MVSVVLHASGPLEGQPRSSKKGHAVRREAPYPELLSILDDCQDGVTSLCYRLLSDRTCAHTGKPLDPNDGEANREWEAGVSARRARGEVLKRWEPSVANLESGNQAMMVAVGWHRQILRYLGCYGDKAYGKRLTATKARLLADDPLQQPHLRVIAACYKLLYFMCWDHYDNWRELSDARTLAFLFRQLDDLSGVRVDGTRLNWWVAKLLEEIIVDNSEANRRLDGKHIDGVVQRLCADGVDGRAQYVAILKSVVEDDVQPLPLRQIQVVEALTKVRELAPSHNADPDAVLLFLRDADNKHRTEHVIGLYAAEKERAQQAAAQATAQAQVRGSASMQDLVAAATIVDHDGLPDPTNVDCDLNYHLEMVDLLGMCAKGRNEVTEKFCRALYDEVRII